MLNFFSIDLSSAQIFPIKLLLVDPVYHFFLWISPTSINLISALFFKSSCSWSTGYALFVDCHIDRVYTPFFQLRCSWCTGYAHFCGFPHLPLTLDAFQFSNDAAPNGPGMPILRIAPSSIDLVCVPYFQLHCSWWTGYAHFLWIAPSSINLKLYTLYFSNLAALSRPGMPFLWIDLVCALFF